MKVQNMVSEKTGKAIANQFIIEQAPYPKAKVAPRYGKMFQSYNSNIVFITYDGNVFLDENYWDYSVTTGKYRNQFLGEGIQETRKKIESGEYILTDLNGG